MVGRRVEAPGHGWLTLRSLTGDIHILPFGEEEAHTPEACICNPKIALEGATLIVTHNAFDLREIVDQALELLNGVDSCQ